MPEVDIYRVGAEVYALAGKGAYEEYRKGCNAALQNPINTKHEWFYVLYAAVIATPYYHMLVASGQAKQLQAQKWDLFLEQLLQQNVLQF